MPKSGKATQWCPCGSNLRPHIAVSIGARSLHVNPRRYVDHITVYVCEKCVSEFNRAMVAETNFSRTVNVRMRDRILGIFAGVSVPLWEEIAALVPK